MDQHSKQRNKINACHQVNSALSSNGHILLQDLPGKVIGSCPSVDQGQIECRLLLQSNFICWLNCIVQSLYNLTTIAI